MSNPKCDMIAVSLACPKDPKSLELVVSETSCIVAVGIDRGAHDLAHYKEQMNSPKSKCFPQ